VLGWFLAAAGACAVAPEDVGYPAFAEALAAYPLPTIEVAQVEALLDPVHTWEVGRVLRDTFEWASIPAYVHLEDAEHWLGPGYLQSGAPIAPGPAGGRPRVQCHSWVGRLGVDEPVQFAVDTLRRLDFAIERDDVTAVVSLDNGESAVPDLLAHAYNVITVGRLDGFHSRGGTRHEGAGRVRPDVVGPFDATSLNVPLTTALAAALYGLAGSDESLSAAAKPTCIRALILAGASRGLLPSWSPDEGRPLDPVFGAGLINLYHSFTILQFGEQDPNGASYIQPLGWDAGTIDDAAPHLYGFTIPDGTHLEEVTLALVWPRQILDRDPGPSFVPEPVLPNLELTVIEWVDGDRFELRASSWTRGDNVEFIALPRLAAGDYAMVVTADGPSEYALAWFSRPVVE